MEKEKEKQKIYFYHTSKTVAVKYKIAPASTICLQKVGDKFIYGVSICSKDDNFNKKVGREISKMRMNKCFGSIDVPKVIKDLPDHKACIQQLSSLAFSLLTKQKRWRKRVTKFNNRFLQETPLPQNLTHTVLNVTGDSTIVTNSSTENY
jgi:hypothetical protein